MYLETRHDSLVQQLKDEIWRVIFILQKEEHLETEDIRKEIDDEFSLDIINEYFERGEEIEKILDHDKSKKD